MSAGDGHEQRRRRTLARNIADDNAEMILVDEKVIEEVAADGAGRGHLGVQIEIVAVRERRKDAGHQRMLNGARGFQFTVDCGELFAVAGGAHHFGGQS